MSPAGAATGSYRTVRLGRYETGPLLLAALVGLFILVSGGKSTARGSQAPVAALSPAWQQFQTAYVAGPAPGQGNTGSACDCWEQHLKAVAVGPADAVDILTAAQIGQGAAYTVRENIGKRSGQQRDERLRAVSAMTNCISA